MSLSLSLSAEEFESEEGVGLNPNPNPFYAPAERKDETRCNVATAAQSPRNLRGRRLLPSLFVLQQCFLPSGCCRALAVIFVFF